MNYSKNNEKFSHCQYTCHVYLKRSTGFVALEFIATLFMVTSFIWVISLYIALSARWQYQASNRLLGLTLARDCIESKWARLHNFQPKDEHQEGVFSIKIENKKYPMPRAAPRFGKKEVPIESFEVAVTGHDDQKNMYTIQLQTHS